MGKPTKRQRLSQKFNYSKNRKRSWKKRKQLPDIKCDQIKSAWDKTKSVNKNLEDMGICADPNKTFKIRQRQNEDVTMDVDEKSFPKEHVVKALEAEASIPAAKTNKLSDCDVHFCTYMLDKHGDDFKAMAKDRQNHYQDTPKQIRKKINMFKNTPSQYEEYLKSKVDDACGKWDKMCCSPVTMEIRSLPGNTGSSRPDRRVTRKYEAARRNGHYTRSPEAIVDTAEPEPPVTLSRVKRKLNFGRKPPRERTDSQSDK